MIYHWEKKKVSFFDRSLIPSHLTNFNLILDGWKANFKLVILSAIRAM